MDDHLAVFLEEFGNGKNAELPEDSFFSKNAGRLPSGFLSFIRQEGFASYADGIVWTLNPNKLGSYVNAWCNLLEPLSNAQYTVFGRSAFGDVYAIQEGSGKLVTVSFATGIVWCQKNFSKPSKRFDAGLQSFFGSAYPKDFDIEDDSGASLFEQGIALFGSIGPNEVFGFEPALAIGGEISVAALRKFRLDVHIDFLSQLSAPVLRSV